MIKYLMTVEQYLVEYFNTIILKRYSDKKWQKNSIAMIIKIVIKVIRVKKFFSTEF